jgi:cytochrome b6
MKWKFHVLFCREVRDLSLSYLTEERLEIQSIADDVSSKYVPPHVNIFYCLGGLTFTCFIIQVATGFAMVRNVIKLGYWRS